MILNNTARLAKNIYGQYTLGWYTLAPGQLYREARYWQVQDPTPEPLVAKAKTMGVTHLFDYRANGALVPIAET